MDLLTELCSHSSCFSYFVFFVLQHLTVVQDVCWRLMTSLIKASHIVLPNLQAVTVSIIYRFLTLRLLISNRLDAICHCVAIEGGLNNSMPCGDDHSLRIVRNHYH